MSAITVAELRQNFEQLEEVFLLRFLCHFFGKLSYRAHSLLSLPLSLVCVQILFQITRRVNVSIVLFSADQVKNPHTAFNGSLYTVHILRARQQLFVLCKQTKKSFSTLLFVAAAGIHFNQGEKEKERERVRMKERKVWNMCR